MTLSGEIKQQASSCAVGIKMTKNELQPRLDKYWNEVKDILPDSISKAALKGGYRKITRPRVVKVSGGRTKFYAPVLLDIISEFLDSNPRQAIAVNDVSLTSVDDSNVNIAALVYLEPEIKWKKKPGIDEPLVIKLPKQPENLVEMLVEQELKKKQGESVVLAPLPDDTQVSIDNVVVLDAVSVVVKDDGSLEQWPPGCFNNQKWLVNEEVTKAPELIKLLVGMTKGGVRTDDIVLNDKFGQDAGKKMRVTLKVHQVYSRTMPKIDDDLAKTNGYDSLDVYRQSLTLGFKKKTLANLERLKTSQIVGQLVNPEVVEVGAIPIEWLRAKGQELYVQARSHVKTEEELVSTLKGAQTADGTAVTDKGTVVRLFAEKAATDLICDLVLRDWGRQMGVEGDTTLKNIDKYVDACMAKLLEVAKFEDVELQQTP